MKKMVLAGRILAAPAVLLLAFSAYMKFFPNQEAMEGMAKSGMTMELVKCIGVIELLCLIVYLIPQTAVLGAILLTGYLGGATFSHVKAGEPPIVAIIVGIVVWGSLFLRDERVRQLMPWRKL